MRPLLIAIAIATLASSAVACGNSPDPYPPLPEHAALSAKAGYEECLAQAEGKLDADFFTPVECQGFYDALDAGLYDGP